MAPVDMLAGRSPSVTNDGVMGGRSSGTATATAEDGSIEFRGTINTNGGGFSYMTIYGSGTMDLSSADGLHVAFDTMESAQYGAAPIAFSISLSGSGPCALEAAFAVPTTAVAKPATAWVPLSDFVAKGGHRDYGSGRTGVPAYCLRSGQTTELSNVARFAIGVYYQNGPFLLKLREMAALDAAPPARALGSTAAASLLEAAAQRARTLVSKAGAGVGAAQMNAAAGAVLACAARQSARASLVAEADAVAASPAASRVARLLAAFDRADASDGDNAAPPPPSTAPVAAAPRAAPLAAPLAASGAAAQSEAAALAAGSAVAVLLLGAVCALLWRRRARAPTGDAAGAARRSARKEQATSEAPMGMKRLEEVEEPDVLEVGVTPAERAAMRPAA